MPPTTVHRPAEQSLSATARLAQELGSGASWAAALAAHRVAVALISAEGIVIAASPAFAELVGLSACTLVGTPLATLRPARELVDALYRTAGERSPYHHRARAFDDSPPLFGGVIVADWSLTPVADEGRPGAALLLVQDVTARLRAFENASRQVVALETQLAAAEKVGVAEALRDAGDGYLQLDADGLIVDANLAYLAHSGYTRAELATMKLAQIEAGEHCCPPVDGPKPPICSYAAVHRSRSGAGLSVEVQRMRLPGGSGSHCLVRFLGAVSS